VGNASEGDVLWPFLGPHIPSAETCKSGDKLLELCMEKKLIIVNSRFPSQQGTWVPPQRKGKQRFSLITIDHTSVSQAFFKNILECHVDTVRVPLELKISDHHPTMTRLKLTGNIRPYRSQHSDNGGFTEETARPDFKLLKSDKDLARRFSEAIDEAIEPIMIRYQDQTSPQLMYNELSIAMDSVCDTMHPPQRAAPKDNQHMVPQQQESA
jgi:hypothetical protein